MITALRNALFCTSVKQQPNGQVDILGIRPDSLTYSQRPWLETLDLFLTVDFDGKGAKGHVQLDAPHYVHRVPFAAPAGITSTGMFFTLTIPIVEPGFFTVSVVDGANRTRPFKVKWKLGFDPKAENLGDEKAADLIRFCNEETEKLLSSLHGRAPETH